MSDTTVNETAGTVNLSDRPIAEVPPRMFDKYIVRGKKAEQKVSGKGNDMIQWTCEIASPLEVIRDNQKYSLDGLEFSYFLMLTEKGLNDIAKLHKRLGLPMDNFDPKKPNTSLYEGIEFEAILNSEDDIPQKVKTDENGAPLLDDRGKKIYEALTDAEGKPIIRGRRITNYIGDILGRASSGVNKAF